MDIDGFKQEATFAFVFEPFQACPPLLFRGGTNGYSKGIQRGSFVHHTKIMAHASLGISTARQFT